MGFTSWYSAPMAGKRDTQRFGIQWFNHDQRAEKNFSSWSHYPGPLKASQFHGPWNS